MNNSSSRRKRNRRPPAMSSDSSVSSVSSGESDASYNHHRNPNKSRRNKSSRNNSPTKSIQKSVFSGFWSDAEIDVDDGDTNNNKETNKKSGRNHRNSGNNNNNNNKGSIDYEGFYLTIGDFIYEIGVGDVVAMRNSFEPQYNPPPEDGSDDDDDDEENSREKRRKRRLERSGNDTEKAQEAMKQQPNANNTTNNHNSSEYTLDAMSEKPSDYYKAVPTADESATAATANTNVEKGNEANPGGSNDGAMTNAAEGAKDASGDKQPPTLESPNKTGAAAATTTLTTPVAATIRPPPPVPMPKEAKLGDDLMLARVERIWQERTPNSSNSQHFRSSMNTTSPNNNNNAAAGAGKVLFKARWFLKKEDVDSLPLGELNGPVSSEVFANTITEHDLVLSNQSDDNHVTTICDVIQVLYRNPELDTEMPSHVLPGTYLCRYSLRIDDDSRVVVLPYTGESDDWKEMTVSALNSKKRSVHSKTMTGGPKGSPGQFLHNLLTPQGTKKRRAGGSSDEDENAPYSGITASAQKRRRVGDFATASDEGIDEGTALQRDIQVGPAHQVSVPKFNPSKSSSTIVSRNPVRMWKPDKISQDGTDDYIERAARILTPYLRKHHLTQEEPYAPFPTQKMEELSKSLSKQRLPTLSSVSSVSSLTTHQVDALREFNVDALLRNLHVSNYNVQAAIAAIEASPMDYLVAWSPHEKARFNTGFRRYSGSLRAIYKGMGNKDLKDVIDYHYRFKIPDQFRKVQERKREQAIRMLECIETKRNLNAPIVVSTGMPPLLAGGTSDEIKEKGDWTKTGSASLAVSLEERRIKAKALLLDVEAKLGRNKMMKVFEVFKHADETTIVECKTKLLEIFSGHREFQSRFLEFMPVQLRL